jgi:hypothetical protein
MTRKEAYDKVRGTDAKVLSLSADDYIELVRDLGMAGMQLLVTAEHGTDVAFTGPCGTVRVRVDGRMTQRTMEHLWRTDAPPSQD